MLFGLGRRLIDVFKIFFILAPGIRELKDIRPGILNI
jgi:hypothetical protein